MLQLLKVIRQSTAWFPIGYILPWHNCVFSFVAEQATDSVAGICVMRFWKLITSSEQDEELVYEITKSLWNGNSRWLLDNGHVKGRSITLDSVLEGIATPLHPGSELFYREIGMIAGEQ